MCVIYACGTILPPEDELERGAWKNDDGAGVAWVDQAKKRVCWKKGLKDDKEVLQYIKDTKVPFPLAIHFRTASVGGKSPALTHPFPIAEGAPLWLEGYAPEVLMHNGHLVKWDDLVLQAGLAAKDKFPDGPWSDTRALAWLTYLKGDGIIRFINESSRVLMLHAVPEWEGEDEDGKPDPWSFFSFWGQWVGKTDNGFMQSISTEYYNRGGVVVYKGGAAAAAPSAYSYSADDDDDDDTTTVGAYKLSAENVWSVTELQEVLLNLEEELENARAASRV
jgi:hypothetical protein